MALPPMQSFKPEGWELFSARPPLPTPTSYAHPRCSLFSIPLALGLLSSVPQPQLSSWLSSSSLGLVCHAGSGEIFSPCHGVLRLKPRQTSALTSPLPGALWPLPVTGHSQLSFTDVGSVLRGKDQAGSLNSRLTGVAPRQPLPPFRRLPGTPDSSVRNRTPELCPPHPIPSLPLL